MTEIEQVIITLEEYLEMNDRLYWLDCLEEAGVDGWEGYEEALELYTRENVLDD